MTKAKKFNCEDIRECWDFRLSIGSPILYDNEETWKVRIWANNPEGEQRKLLHEHDTGIATSNNPHDKAGIAACNEWLYSVRDKYARDHIELRKPVVKMINEANAEAARINAVAMTAQVDGDMDTYHRCIGERTTHIKESDIQIKAACAALKAQIADANAGAAS